MSSLIITNEQELVKPKDPYWDASPSRREMQKVVNDLSVLIKVISDMQDTCNIVMNLACLKLNITRVEIETYVQKLKAQKAIERAEAANEQSNG